MLKRRLWYLKGIADDHYFGVIGEEKQLERIERALFLTPEDRWSEDEEIMNEESQLFELSIEAGFLSPRRSTWKPLLPSEVRREVAKRFDNKVPDSLQKILDNLTSDSEPNTWEGHPKSDVIVNIAPLGPLNFRTL